MKRSLCRRLSATLLCVACLMGLALPALASTASEAAAALEENLRRPYPEGYGGMYYKDAKLHVVIIAMTHKERDALIAEIQPCFRYISKDAYAFAWRRQGYSLAQLEALNTRIARFVERNGNTYAALPGGGQSPYVLVEWSINVQENRVDVGLADIGGSAVSLFRRAVANSEALHFYQCDRVLEGVNAVDTPQGDDPTIATATATVNVRSGPGTAYGRLGQLKRGQEVAVVGKAGMWASIQWGSGVGYVSLSYLKITGHTGMLEDAGERVAATATGNVNVRSGPSTAYARLGQLKKGESVTVTAQNGNWARVRWNGRDAYVSMDYLWMPVSVLALEAPTTDGGSLGIAETTARVNVRTGPGTSYGKLGQLKRGADVAVWDIQNGWAQITYGPAANSRAYVSAQYLAFID